VDDERSDGPEQGSLAEAFWQVARRLRHQSREALAPWGVSPSQLRALGVLLRHGAVRSGELAEHLRIAPRSATEVVDALAERGLVERRPDPEDRRATQVVATEAGIELGRAVQAARAVEADRVFATLGDDDRAELTRLLRLLAEG
jgi:DNA-binding MarR family transcriptional regulator